MAPPDIRPRTSDGQVCTIDTFYRRAMSNRSTLLKDLLEEAASDPSRERHIEATLATVDVFKDWLYGNILPAYGPGLVLSRDRTDPVVRAKLKLYRLALDYHIEALQYRIANQVDADVRIWIDKDYKGIRCLGIDDAMWAYLHLGENDPVYEKIMWMFAWFGIGDHTAEARRTAAENGKLWLAVTLATMKQHAELIDNWEDSDDILELFEARFGKQGEADDSDDEIENLLGPRYIGTSEEEEDA